MFRYVLWLACSPQTRRHLMKLIGKSLAHAALATLGFSATQSQTSEAAWSWHYNSYWPSYNYYPSNSFAGGWYSRNYSGYSSNYGSNFLYVCRTYGNDYLNGNRWFYGNYNNNRCNYGYSGRSLFSNAFGLLLAFYCRLASRHASRQLQFSAHAAAANPLACAGFSCAHF